jgi:cytochrome c553
MKLAAALAASIALLLSTAAWADGDAARGKAKAAPCFSCHGETGNSTMPGIPSLAAQPPGYTFLQLFLFREKLRNVPTMTPFVEGLPDQDLEDFAAYFAGQKLEPLDEPRDPARYQRGAELSQRLRCASCHGAGYGGQVQMPRLAGQREDYLLGSMEQYQTNERTGIDTNMAAVVYGVPSADLAALAHYMAQHRP